MTTIRTVAPLVLAGVLALAGLAGGAPARPDPPAGKGEPVLFRTVPTDKAGLTEKQRRAYEAIRGEPTTVRASLVVLDPRVLETAGRGFRFSDDPMLDFVTRDCTVERRGGAISVECRGREPGDSATLTVRGKMAVGVVDAGKWSYEVKPLGGGAHALVRVDVSKSVDGVKSPR